MNKIIIKRKILNKTINDKYQPILSSPPESGKTKILITNYVECRILHQLLGHGSLT